MASLVPMIRKLFEVVKGNVWLPSGPSVPVGGSAVRPAGWQLNAWRFWHVLGEIRFPTEHLARQVGRVDWDVTIDGVELTREDAAAFMAEVTYGMGVREASRMMGLNLQVGGEGWWIEEAPGIFQVYSVVTPGLDRKVRETRAAGRIALRLFFPDPVDVTQAESAVQTALGPADELVTLEALSRAQSRSRIAQAGMLLVPSEAKWDDADPFGADLERAMELAIKDPAHPAAMVPIKVELTEDLIERVKHLQFSRPYDEKVHERVVMATKRVALALDVPAELLLGAGEATHWTAWLTALETYTSHLEPLAAPIGELYAAVAEMLLQRTGRTVTVTITPNPGRILAKRSTVRDALDAAKLGAVGLRYIRDAIGANDEDAPTDEELAILLRIPREPGREPMADEGTGEATPSGPDPVTAALSPSPIAGAMAIAFESARAKLGAKIRTAVRSTPLADRLDGIDNAQVATVLGAAQTADIVDADTVVYEALAPFEDWWNRTRPSQLSGRLAAVLFAQHIVDTIEDPDPDVAPAKLVADLITSLNTTTAGGHHAA